MKRKENRKEQIQAGYWIWDICETKWRKGDQAQRPFSTENVDNKRFT